MPPARFRMLLRCSTPASRRALTNWPSRCGPPTRKDRACHCLTLCCWPRLLSPKVAAITLWVGLGLLTLTLAALMVTRWGQTQSIAKCAVLSVWAHVLLGVYATTVDIVFTPPPGNGREGSNLHPRPGSRRSRCRRNRRRGRIDRHVETVGTLRRCRDRATGRPASFARSCCGRTAEGSAARGCRFSGRHLAGLGSERTRRCCRANAAAQTAGHRIRQVKVRSRPGCRADRDAGRRLPARVRRSSQRWPMPKPGGLPRLAEKANSHDAQGYLEDHHDQPSGGSGQRPVAETGGDPSPQTIEALRALLTPGNLASAAASTGAAGSASCSPAVAEAIISCRPCTSSALRPIELAWPSCKAVRPTRKPPSRRRWNGWRRIKAPTALGRQPIGIRSRKQNARSESTWRRHRSRHRGHRFGAAGLSRFGQYPSARRSPGSRSPRAGILASLSRRRRQSGRQGRDLRPYVLSRHGGPGAERSLCHERRSAAVAGLRAPWLIRWPRRTARQEDGVTARRMPATPANSAGN